MLRGIIDRCNWLQVTTFDVLANFVNFIETMKEFAESGVCVKRLQNFDNYAHMFVMLSYRISVSVKI